MPRSNYGSNAEYRKSMRGDVNNAYNKSMNGQGGAKKPDPKKMSAGGKKTSTGTAVGGA